jgi:hypothetical protein
MHGLGEAINTLYVIAIIGLISIFGWIIFALYKLVTWIF